MRFAPDESLAFSGDFFETLLIAGVGRVGNALFLY
jgi:hypothetical protein